MIVANSFKTPTAADALAGHDGTSNWSPRMFALADVLSLATQQITTQITQATIGITRTTADNTGATDATAQLVADLATAIAAGHKRFYLPAGTYRITKATGAALAVSTDGVELFGDGIGKTILQYADDQTLTGNVQIMRLTGRDQAIRGMSFVGGANTTYGTRNLTAIAIETGCYRPHIADIEVSGFEGGGTAGGGGITTSQSWNTAEVSTTLGTTIASGAQTVTPGSMDGIYPGRRLTIGGTSEEIVVTSSTATTFTATFANAHNSADSVTGKGQGHQYAVIERCSIHDCYRATAIVLNSSANVVRDCRIVRVGSNSVQHGMYIQGGQNLISGNYFEGVGGYSIHGHKAVPNIDASGDQYIGNISINPGTCHIIVDNLDSDGTNPEVPSGHGLTRYATIANNVLRNTNLRTSQGIRCEVACAVSGNMLEDICPTDGSGWIAATVRVGSAIVGNILRTTNPATAGINCSFIRGNGATIGDNQITTASTAAMSGISVTGNSTVTNNRVSMSGSASHRGVSVSGDNNTVRGNTIDAGTGTALRFDGTIAGLEIAGNRLTGAGIVNIDLSTVGGECRDNVFVTGQFRYTVGNTAFRFRGNTGGINYGGDGAAALTSDCGALIPVTTDGTALTAGRLVKPSGATLGTSDTVAIGVAVSTTPASAVIAYLVAQPGAVAPIDADDAWTAGHYAIPSTTTGGKVHDGGTSPPASGSYGVFLDSGGAAGVARVMLLRTL